MCVWGGLTQDVVGALGADVDLRVRGCAAVCERARAGPSIGLVKGCLSESVIECQTHSNSNRGLWRGRDRMWAVF